MCLLCGGPTLAAYAVDNDIVVMNGAHTLLPLSACIQESNVHYIHTEYTASCGGCARGKLVSIESPFRHHIIDTEAVTHGTEKVVANMLSFAKIGQVLANPYIY